MLLASLFALGMGSLSMAVMLETASIEDVMTKGHKRGGYRDVINAEVKKGSPDWSALQTAATDFKAIAGDLGKNKPPKGTEAAWKKACDEYLGFVNELDAAAQKKDKAKVQSALSKIAKTCQGCHNNHRP